MRFFGLHTAAIAAAIGTALLVFSCSNTPVPSTADVQKAFSAFNNADTSIETTDNYSSPSSYGSTNTLSQTVTNPSGTGQASLSFTANTSSSPMTMSGSITFTNWTDPSSGYTLNGTIKLTETVTTTSSSESITATITGTLNLSGGSISTLVYDVKENATIDMSTYNVTESFTGTVTANGHSFDASTIA